MIVLDASALIALLYGEPGADAVRTALPSSCMSTVNLAEVYSRFTRDGVDIGPIRSRVRNLPIAWEPLSIEQAEIAADLLPETKRLGLSLGDRCCLALAMLRQLPVLTADRAWAGLDLGITVQLIR